MYIEVGQPASQERSLADIWSALGGELKPSLDVVVTAPIVVYTRRRIGPPVLAGPTIGLSRLGGAGETAAGRRRAGPAAARAAARGDRAARRGRTGRRHQAPGARPPPVSAGDGAALRAPAATPRRRDPTPRRRGAGRGPATRPRRPAPADPSLAYLFARLGLLEARVRAAVDRRRARRRRPRGPVPRPVHLRGAGRRAARRAGGPARAAAAEVAAAAPWPSSRRGPPTPRRPARGSGYASSPARSTSSPIDVELLLVALAPDLDPRFERLYGYLHDDVSRRRASVGLALELCAAAARPPDGAGRRERPGPLAPLVAGGLLLVEDADRPIADPLAPRARTGSPPTCSATTRRTRSSRPCSTDSVRVDLPRSTPSPAASPPGSRSCTCASAPGRPGARSAGRRSRRARPAGGRARPRPPGAADEPCAIAAAASREARLRGAGLVVGPVEPLVERGAGGGPRVRRAAGAGDPRRRPRAGTRPGRASRRWCSTRPSRRVDQRHELWAASLDGDAPEGFDPAVATIAFRLAPEQIDRAAAAARRGRDRRRRGR